MLFSYKSSLPPAFTQNQAVVTSESVLSFLSVAWGPRLAGLVWGFLLPETAGEVLVSAETLESTIINNKLFKCVGVTRPRDQMEFSTFLCINSFHICHEQVQLLLLNIKYSNGTQFGYIYHININIFEIKQNICVSMAFIGFKLQKCFREKIKLSDSRVPRLLLPYAWRSFLFLDFRNIFGFVVILICSILHKI